MSDDTMLDDAAIRPPLRAPRKRDAVIAAARIVFADKGYNASMEEVALEAGVSKQTIYNQFGSKEQLFHAMIEDRVAQMLAPLLDAVPDADPRDVLTRIGTVYHTKIISPENVRLQRTLLAAPAAAPMLREIYQQGPTRFSQVFTDWLQAQHDAGRLNVPDPELAAEHFVSFTFGKLYMRRLFGIDAPLDLADIKRRVAYCVDVFLRAHAPGGVNSA